MKTFKKIIYPVISGLILAIVIAITNIYYFNGKSEEDLKYNIENIYNDIYNHFDYYDLIFVAIIVFLAFKIYKLNQPSIVAHSDRSYRESELEKKAKKKYKLLKSKNKIEEFSKVYADLKGTGGQLSIDDIQFYLNNDLITSLAKHPLTGTYYKLTPTGEKVNEIIHD